MRGSDGPHFARLLRVTMQNPTHLVVVLLHGHGGVIGRAYTKSIFHTFYDYIIISDLLE